MLGDEVGDEVEYEMTHGKWKPCNRDLHSGPASQSVYASVIGGGNRGRVYGATVHVVLYCSMQLCTVRIDACDVLSQVWEIRELIALCIMVSWETCEGVLWLYHVNNTWAKKIIFNFQGIDDLFGRFHKFYAIFWFLHWLVILCFAAMLFMLIQPKPF